MKFKDLPIDTKFTDEMQLSMSYNYCTKTGDNLYCHEELGAGVYPLLMWEDEMELLND